MLFAVALLSSALTCLALWFYYQRVVAPAIDQRIAEAVEAIGVEVGKQVRAGVVDGVTDLAKGDAVVRKTGEVASKGASVIAESLGVLLGGTTGSKNRQK